MMDEFDNYEWFIDSDGDVIGPYTAEQIDVYVVEGTLRGDDLIRKGGERVWQTVSSRPWAHAGTEYASQLSGQPEGPVRRKLKWWQFLLTVFLGSISFQIVKTITVGNMPGIVHSTVAEPSNKADRDFVASGGIIIALRMDGRMPANFEPWDMWEKLKPSTCRELKERNLPLIRNQVVFSDRVFPSFDYTLADCNGSNASGPGRSGYYTAP